MLALLTACSPKEQVAEPLDRTAPVWPDVDGVTVPRNLAPVRFALDDSSVLTSLQAVYEAAGMSVVVKGRGDGEIAISIEDWQRLVQNADTVSIRIQGKQEGRWCEYAPLHIAVTSDSIDPYLVYRLIEPGYEVWGEMGIYERDLQTYEERAVLTNRETAGGCMNCHSFCQNNPSRMLLHLRQQMAGTYIRHDGKVERLDTKTPQTLSALVYPSWHPLGQWVAFSTNLTKQVAHSTDRNRVEVYDLQSDVVVLDVESHELVWSPLLKSDDRFETFPCFGPDGRSLYFCSADSVDMTQTYDQVHYSLCRIDFDAETGEFGTQVDTLYNARTEGGSATQPRVSPDGRWLMYVHSDYGQFTIWHKDADLRVMRLNEERRPERAVKGEEREDERGDEKGAWKGQPSMAAYGNRTDDPAAALNSEEAESYHSWSSTGKWVVFDSRRMDGLYTRPYLAHVDEEGHWSKPVLLPQEDVHYYDRLMKSYNVPEMTTGKVDVTGMLGQEEALKLRAGD